MHHLTINNIITKFQLTPHPEGGWYKETYRAAGTIQKSVLPTGFKGDRSFSTAIYFLLEHSDFSAFHRIQSDECWHFYAGGTLIIYIIGTDAVLQKITLGNNILQGETFQYVVPAGCWFASAPAEGTDYSFVGCTVAPGFDFDDFELAEREELIGQYPEHGDIIIMLTR